MDKLDKRTPPAMPAGPNANKKFVQLFVMAFKNAWYISIGGQRFLGKHENLFKAMTVSSRL